MKKSFNRVQTLKSSGNCDKYSTRFLYKNLVGETATIGTGIKQIRRLFLGSADKPLSAVGTLTSLLCNFAKVVENLLRYVITRRTSVRRGYLPEQCTHANQESLFASVTCFMRLPRRIQRMLLVMTFPVLAIFFTLFTTAESQAAEIPTGGASGTCNSAGTCLWTLDENGKMTISAAEGAKEVKMDNYSCVGAPICSSQTGNRPWENYLKQIEHVVVSNNIINIGSDSFQNATALKTVTGMKDVKTISTDAFLHTTSLSSIETPNVEAIGNEAFVSTSLSSIDLPNILQIGGDVFRNARNLAYIGLPKKNVSINDGAFINTNLANCSNENRAACGSCGNDYVSGNDYVKSGLGCVSDCGAGYLGKEGRCIDASLGCGVGYRQFENFCNRIQYTPAEASKVLRDNNTNEVTITFKK